MCDKKTKFKYNMEELLVHMPPPSDVIFKPNNCQPMPCHNGQSSS